MFRSKVFSVRRRFSDFLGLYEKLSVKQSLHGCIIPPPPEKSVVGGCQAFVFFFFGSALFFPLPAVWHVSFGSTGMTKVKVGMDDPSSVEFVERRRAALERCGSIYDLHSDIISVMSSFFVVVFLLHFLLHTLHPWCHCALCRYLQRVVSHPSLLQDPDVREFLEREDVSISRYKK